MTTLTINIDSKIKEKAQKKIKKEGATMTFLINQFLDSYVRGKASFHLNVEDPDCAYFYTKEWQKMEREADDDIKKGRISEPFDNIKDLMKSLEC